jgi:rhodanese-related sulfurtransferase
MTKYLAMALEKPTPLAYTVAADIFVQKGLYKDAAHAINKAMALAPNDPEAYVSNARILNATGQAAEAEAAVRKALRLDPQYAPGSLRVLALSLFHQQKYQDAISTLQRVLSQQSDVAEDYATLVSCLGHLGRADGVKEAIDKYNALSVSAGYDPLTVQEAGWWWYGDMFTYDDVYRARLQEGLRKAGVPEGGGTDLPLAEYKSLIVRNDGLYRVTGAIEINAAEAKSLWDRGGVTFIDVRGIGEFNAEHIARAKNVSLGELSNESLAKLIGRNDEIVFSCLGKYCPYSAYASAKALLWGYKHVYRFAGGFPAWKDAGYPVETSLSDTKRLSSSHDN